VYHESRSIVSRAKQYTLKCFTTFYSVVWWSHSFCNKRNIKKEHLTEDFKQKLCWYIKPCHVPPRYDRQLIERYLQCSSTTCH